MSSNNVNTQPSNNVSNNASNKDYKVLGNTPIPPGERASNPFDVMPPRPPNGGLYGGPDCDRPWLPIDVTPTATNYIANNLRSANPPPGAIEQYVGTNRLGNNYTAMPESYWYNNTTELNPGPFNLKVTKN